MSAATPNTRKNFTNSADCPECPTCPECPDNTDTGGDAIVDPVDKAAYDAANQGDWVIVSEASMLAYVAALGATRYGANDALFAYGTGYAALYANNVNTISAGVVGTTGRGSDSIPPNNFPAAPNTRTYYVVKGATISPAVARFGLYQPPQVSGNLNDLIGGGPSGLAARYAATGDTNTLGATAGTVYAPAFIQGIMVPTKQW